MDFRDRKAEAEAQWGRKICCSESVMLCLLQDLEYDEERARDLVRAMGAFCGGTDQVQQCGALSGGVAAMYVAVEDYRQAKEELRPEIVAWFRERYQTTQCADILEGDEMRKVTVCPDIMAEVYAKVHDILIDAGAL